jgi:DNA-binding response OmpR family regulator
MEVAHVRWPGERARRELLAHRGQPRLLLLDEGTPPPGEVDELEDWIRLPADDVDVKARVEHLIQRSQRHLPVTPSLENGVLRVRETWVALSPLEARLTAILLERMGAVVSRDTMARTGWPEGTRARNTLDVHVVRLRRRLASVGLAIHTVRSRGYLLELSGSYQQDVHQA